MHWRTLITMHQCLVCAYANLYYAPVRSSYCEARDAGQKLAGACSSTPDRASRQGSMSTKTPAGDESTGTNRSTDTETATIPDGAALIGVDAEGAFHWLGNRVTHDGVPVYVEDDGDVEVWDLTETPCTKAEDIVEGWISHVERKRGTWARKVYNQPLAVTLAERVEVED